MLWCSDESTEITFLQHLTSQASQNKNSGVFGHFFCIPKRLTPSPDIYFKILGKKVIVTKKST
jgi:hypothetical protein